MAAKSPGAIRLDFSKRKILAALLLLATLGVAVSASAAPTIVSTSGSTMYTDLGNGLDSTYLVFKITGDAAYADVWARLDTHGGNISNVDSGIHQLRFAMGGAGLPPTPELGLGNGETKGVFFMVTAGATSTTPQTLTVNLYDANPVPGPATLIGTQNFSFTVADTIQANANKVTTVVTVPANPAPGELGTITVTGCTGTVGAANVEYFSPVSQNSWPPDLFEFVDSDINIENYPNNNYKDVAKIPPADVLSTDNCYTEIFTFVIDGFGSASTSPANFISSGTQIKHTTNTSGTFDVVIPHGDVSVTKTQTDPLPASNPLLGGTNVTYHVEATNGGPAVATNVALTDSITSGTGVTFVSIANITSNLADCSATPPTSLPFTCHVASLANGASASFDLTVTLPNDGQTSITNEASVVSDTDANADNDTADVTTTICPTADLGVVKTTNDLTDEPISTVTGGDDFKYHIVVTNGGPNTAVNVVVTDVLPAGMTYVSDDQSCDSTTTPGTVTCSVASLLNAGTFTINIRVTANDSGSIDNTATVSSDTCDGNSANNSSKATIDVITNNQPVALRADEEGCGTDADCPTLVSDQNRVFEPNETARVDPSWKNTLANAEADVKGTASALTGPGDGSTATYFIDDSTADYGPIAAGATSDCNAATTDCYAFTITQTGGTRPHNPDHPRHWDATFHETLDSDGGETKDWQLHIGDSFPDVPRSNIFYRFVETIFHNHITIGCLGGNNFCPGTFTTRQEMGAFIARSVDLLDANVPLVTSDYDCSNPLTPVPGQFVDVPATNAFCKYANFLKSVHVSLGCTDTTHFCPLATVLREDMAVFIARAYEYKLSLDPGPPTSDPDGDVPQWKQSADLTREYNCTGSAQIDPDTLNSIPANTKPFSDVPTSLAQCKHIGLLFVTRLKSDPSKFVIDGSNGTSTGVFLPGNQIRRDETAKILANAFGDLPLYGPLTF